MSTDDDAAKTAAPEDEPTLDASDETAEITESETAEDPKADDDSEKENKPARRETGGRRLVGAARRNLGIIVVAAALVISAVLATGLYLLQYKPDQETNAAAANVALEAAKNGTVALLSYSPESLDKDFANAKSNLTGDFLSYYTQFTEQIVTPAAKEKQVKTVAVVVRAAVAEIHRDSAVVLVFINQTTTSKENPDGAFAASSVKVGMKKVDGRWLISAFDPV